jgi:repressor LexA
MPKKKPSSHEPDPDSRQSERDPVSALSDPELIHSSARRRPIPVLGRVAAGLPILAVGEHLADLLVDPMFAHRDDIFALQVRGDSMSGDGVLDGDYVVVLPEEPRDGDMVVVVMPSHGDEHSYEATVKHLRRNGDSIHLLSSHPDFPPIVLRSSDQPSIQGVVIGVVRWIGRRP